MVIFHQQKIKLHHLVFVKFLEDMCPFSGPLIAPSHDKVLIYRSAKIKKAKYNVKM